MAAGTKTPTCWPGLLLVADQGKLQLCYDLLGKQFYDFVAHGNDVLVSCQDGCRLVSSDGQVQEYCSESFTKLTSGRKFFVGISPDQKLYSWGIDAAVGQLGQGVARKQITSPDVINFSAKFVGISSGEAFTMALDDLGHAYSFGENFSRQLGLYSKEREKMHLKNALVEEMVFSPRLLPLSTKSPLTQVACGLNFAMALTKDGRLFSWGAGDCGQLGTGRCTKKEVPSEVSFDSNNATVLDVACGDSHVIAVLEDGSVYGWGLNQRGQCGTGDLKAKHAPTRVILDEEIKLKKLIAEGHSSAALNSTGGLYTWGSTSHSRLLHSFSISSPEAPAPAAIPQPTKVYSPALEGMEIEKFTFTKNSSAVLVKATLTKVWPLRGPKRNFNQLVISGFGLWNSAQILVKFTSKVYSLYNPPRSSMGKLTREGSISCKPPKFAEGGWYSVSLSMDGGKEFFPQTFDIFVYKEPTVMRQSPAVLDLRLKKIPSMILDVQGQPHLARDKAQVKYSLFKVKSEELSSPSRHATNANRALVLELVVPASLVSESSEGPGEGTPRTLDSNNTKRPTTAETLFQLQCDEIEIEHELHGLFEFTCRLSFNEQDFTGNSSKAEAVSSLCHTYLVFQATPCTYSLSELQRLFSLSNVGEEEEYYGEEKDFSMFERRIVVQGESLFPPSKIPKGSHVTAVWSGCKVIEKDSTEEPTLELIPEIEKVTVYSETLDTCTFHLSVNALKQIYSYLESKSLLSTPLGVQMPLTFQLETPLSEDHVDIITLNSPPLSLYFYAESKLAVDPIIFKRGDGQQKFDIIPAGTDGFIFNPSSALVKVSFINELLPPLLITSRDLVVETKYNEIEVQEVEEGQERTEEKVEEKKILGYSIGFDMPSYNELARNYSHVDHNQVISMSISVALDGVSYSPDDLAASVALFSDLAKYSFQPPLPKGGAAPGSAVGLLLEQYCPAVIPSNKIFVCLHGEDLSLAVVVPGTLSDTSVAGQVMTLIQFSMPDQPTLSKIGPVVQGKEKLLYVDLSIDEGQSYDKAEKPLLQMK